MTTKKTSTKRPTKGKAPAEVADEGDSPARFAYHLAEVLRIGRTAPFIPASLYNDLGNAWNEFVNTAGDGAAFRELHEGEAGVRLLLEIAGRLGEGGEGRPHGGGISTPLGDSDTLQPTSDQEA